MLWIIYALLSATTAALVAVFAKLGLQDIDSTLATTIRSIIMMVFLIIVSISLKKFQGFSLNSFQAKEWLLIIASGIAGATSWLFYFLAIKNGPIAPVAAIDRLSFVIVFILSVLFFGQELSIRSVTGITAMIGGVLLLI